MFIILNVIYESFSPDEARVDHHQLEELVYPYSHYVIHNWFVAFQPIQRIAKDLWD